MRMLDLTYLYGENLVSVVWVRPGFIFEKGRPVYVRPNT
jgi:hypothetical protein